MIAGKFQDPQQASKNAVTGGALKHVFSVDYASKELMPNPDGDLDGDRLSNYEERLLGTNPNLQDTDFDGILDNIEVRFGLDPNAYTAPNDPAVIGVPPMIWLLVRNLDYEYQVETGNGDPSEEGSLRFKAPNMKGWNPTIDLTSPTSMDELVTQLADDFPYPENGDFINNEGIYPLASRWPYFAITPNSFIRTIDGSAASEV